MELMPYKEEINQTVLVFKEILDMDMIVVDRWLATLVNTFHYERKPLDVRLNSIVGNIIVTGKPQIISNRQYSKACLTCQDFQYCELEGVVGVPIWSGEACVGAMAVLIRASRIHVLATHGEKLVAFLERLADLLAKSVQNYELEQQVEESKKQLYTVLDQVTDLAVFTDEEGRIQFCNQSFCDFFDVSVDEVLRSHLWDALAPFAVSMSGGPYQLGETFIGVTGTVAQIREIKRLNLDNNVCSNLYLFKTEDAVQLLNTAKPYEAEQKMRSFWGPSKRMQAAKQAAMAATKNNLPVLIEGVCGDQNRELMKIISRYAPETVKSPTIVQCSIDAEELRHILFGNGRNRVGLLWPPRKCAICLASIEHMPLYLQKRLFEFMADRQMAGSPGSKVRLFATSEKNLEELTAAGRFSEDLLHLIAQNHITIPDIWEDRQDKEYYFRRFVSEFAAVYGCGEITYPAGFFEQLHSGDRMDFLALKELAERFVSGTLEGGAGGVELSRLTESPRKSSKPDMELRLKELMRQNLSKSEIAQALGISRATLYRWLKKYEIEDEA